MTEKDHSHRFTFEESAVRGEIVQLKHSYNAVIAKHDYPGVVEELVGEFLSAVALLSSTIKFKGTLSLQVRGDGAIKMLVAECRDQSTLRAVATFDESIPADSLEIDRQALFGNAQLAITIEPHKGQSYQGIVSLSEQCLSKALEDYFLQSEQLPTRIWLSSDAKGQTAAGLMIQSLPASADQSQLSLNSEDWERITMLSQTITDEELLSLEPEQLLLRLYHEEGVRLHPSKELAFGCSCSRARVANSLLTIGREETERALEASDDEIKIDCHFCRARYLFTRDDVEELFAQKVH